MDRSNSATSITTPAFTTTSGNELLLAFISTDATSAGVRVTAVTGGNLTWVLVQRENAQLGTAEIWRGFATSTLSNVTVTATLSESVAASITVVSFAGVDPSGTNGSGAIGQTAGASASPGAPSASLVTSRNNSWVFGVGNDWDNAIARTPGANQMIVHQYLATVGDTYWVQGQNSPTPLSGTQVFISDTAPSIDRYNLSIVEVLPAPSSGGTTYNISGTVSPASLGSGTVLTLSGTPSLMTPANSSGNYSFTGLSNGSYTVTPNLTGATFTPTSQTVTINGADVGNINFLAEAQAPAGNYPDLSDIIPTATSPSPVEPTPFSIAGSGASRQLQFTHDTYNGGSGPLEIQPVYNAASGYYQGFQHIYSFQSGSWTLVQTIPVAGAFVFDAAHGHFHFPFTSYVLCAVNPDGSVGAPVAASTKNDYCINDSFIYNSSLPNAGPWPNLGSCNDPTSLRGLSIGGADEYDQTDPGQVIVIGTLADGTYWLRAMVDPDDYFAESDKTNNETDIELAISGSTVTVLQSVQPKLTQPPAITLTAPGAGTVSGTVQLTANTSAPGGVQFLVDGLPFGSVVASAPYTLSWATTAVPNGSHWLAAQTTDSTGHAGTSPVVVVTVSNNATTPPTIQLQSPTAGATVNAVISLSATATAQVGIPTVQFFVDNVAVGSPLTAPPFITTWDTQTVANGAHTVGATATDQNGLVGNATPVAITVDNSHPANVIAFDAQLFKDGAGTLQTAAFSTTTTSDLLVAFVAYDGPTNAPQTATVSGGGLNWQLVKRSNTQLGTAEIWAANATDFLTSVTVSAQPGVPGYHGSLSVIAFLNASGTGIVGQASAPTGAPDIYLPGITAGNWVFAVGNDWDNAIPRTPVSGQVLVHQDVDKVVGDTYWVQSTTAPSTANALVDIHDSAPTTDQWNYAAAEIVATRP